MMITFLKRVKYKQSYIRFHKLDILESVDESYSMYLFLLFMPNDCLINNVLRRIMPLKQTAEGVSINSIFINSLFISSYIGSHIMSIKQNKIHVITIKLCVETFVFFSKT